MSTVDKAAELLGYFSERTPEIGLSDLSRMAGFEKATTRRLLLALMKHDYIEQNPDSRAYRLGPGVLRLAKVRESAVPLNSIIAPLLCELVELTGETAHFSLLSGGTITTVQVENSLHSSRIHFVLGEEGPLHATASGLVCLAFGCESLLQNLLQQPLPEFTGSTLTDPDKLRKRLALIRKSGIYVNRENYERDVCSIAAPVISANDLALGAIAVAAPSSRFNYAQQHLISSAVREAARKASHAITGQSGTLAS